MATRWRHIGWTHEPLFMNLTVDLFSFWLNCNNKKKILVFVWDYTKMPKYAKIKFIFILIWPCYKKKTVVAHVVSLMMLRHRLCFFFSDIILCFCMFERVFICKKKKYKKTLCHRLTKCLICVVCVCVWVRESFCHENVVQDQPFMCVYGIVLDLLIFLLLFFLLFSPPFIPIWVPISVHEQLIKEFFHPLNIVELIRFACVCVCVCVCVRLVPLRSRDVFFKNKSK